MHRFTVTKIALIAGIALLVLGNDARMHKALRATGPAMSRWRPRRKTISISRRRMRCHWRLRPCSQTLMLRSRMGRRSRLRLARSSHFYGGRSARTTLNQIPRSTVVSAPAASLPQSTGRPAKPFQDQTERPTLSPYLNLFRDEKAAQGIPNYQALSSRNSRNERPPNASRSNRRDSRRGRLSPHPRAGSRASRSRLAPAPAHFMDTERNYGLAAVTRTR